MTPRFHRLKISNVGRETADAALISFDVPEDLRDAYRFTHGQHLTLRATLDGEELRRSYSICSPAGEALRVAIKRVNGGKFSNFAAAALQQGASIDVMTPDGKFFTPLDRSNAKHYVAFAAGSGITPVISIIKTVLATEPNSRVTLVYGNRSVASIMFREELEDLKDRYLERLALYHLLSRETQEVELFNGRIDGAKCNALLDTLIPVVSIDDAFICGPWSMIDDVGNTLRARGLAEEHIHMERFGSPSGDATPSAEPEALDVRAASVTVIIDGARKTLAVPYEGRKILDAALQAGADLPFSCKGGMCCTCRAKLLSGRVRMEKNYSLEKGELARGFVLTCQAHPETDEVTLSYDER